MLQMLRKRMESEKGFTLIELLVVIRIIGILAAVAQSLLLGLWRPWRPPDTWRATSIPPGKESPPCWTRCASG